MEREGHKCTSIEGGMDMTARDRVVREFREGKTKILIATDVIARGFDVTQARPSWLPPHQLVAGVLDTSKPYSNCLNSGPKVPPLAGRSQPCGVTDSEYLYFNWLQVAAHSGMFPATQQMGGAGLVLFLRAFHHMELCR